MAKTMAAYDLYSDTELRKDLTAIIAALPAITEMWEGRNSQLLRLKAIAVAIAAQPAYTPTLMQFLPELRAVLLVQLTDLRSVVLGSLFGALMQLGHALEAQFGTEVEHYMTALLRLVPVTKKIIASGATKCAHSLTRSSRHASLLQLFLSTYASRNCPPTRQHCVELVTTWVQVTHGTRLAAASAELLSFVKTALGDGALPVRESAARLFVAHLEPLFPIEAQPIAAEFSKRLSSHKRVLHDAENHVNSPVTTRLRRAATLPATAPSTASGAVPPSAPASSIPLQTRAATAEPLAVLTERSNTTRTSSTRRQTAGATNAMPMATSTPTPTTPHSSSNPRIAAIAATPTAGSATPASTSTITISTKLLSAATPVTQTDRVTRKRSASSTAAPSSSATAAPKTPSNGTASTTTSASNTTTAISTTSSRIAKAAGTSTTTATPSTNKPTQRTLATPAGIATKTPTTASNTNSTRARLLAAATPSNTATATKPSKPSALTIDLNPTSAAACAESIRQLDCALAAKQRDIDKRDAELLLAPSIAVNHDLLLQEASAADAGLVHALLAAAKSPTRASLDSLSATLHNMSSTELAAQPPTLLVELVRVLSRALHHSDGDAALQSLVFIAAIMAETLTTLVLAPASPPSAFISYSMTQQSSHGIRLDGDTISRHSVATVLVVGIALLAGSSRQTVAHAADEAFGRLASLLPLVPTLLSAIRRERARITEPRITLHRTLLCFMAKALGHASSSAVANSVVLDATRVLLLDAQHSRSVVANAAREALAVVARTHRASTLEHSRVLLQPHEITALVEFHVLAPMAAPTPIATPRKSAPLPTAPVVATSSLQTPVQTQTPRKSAPLPAPVVVPAPLVVPVVAAAPSQAAAPAARPITPAPDAAAPTSTGSGDNDDDDEEYDSVISFNKPAKPVPSARAPIKAPRSSDPAPLPTSITTTTAPVPNAKPSTTLSNSYDALEFEDVTIELPSSTAQPHGESIALLLARLCDISTDDTTLPQAATQVLATCERTLEHLRGAQHQLAPVYSQPLFEALLPFAGVFVGHELLAEFEAVMLYLYSALQLIEDEQPRRRSLIAMCEALASHGATIKAADNTNVLDTLHAIVFDLIANASDTELAARIVPVLICTHAESGFGLHVITELLLQGAISASQWRSWLPCVLPVACQHLAVTSRDRPTALKLLIFIHASLMPASDLEELLLVRLTTPQRNLLELHVANSKRQKHSSCK